MIEVRVLVSVSTSVSYHWTCVWPLNGAELYDGGGYFWLVGFVSGWDGVDMQEKARA